MVFAIASSMMFGVFVIMEGNMEQPAPSTTTHEDLVLIKDYINNCEELNTLNIQLIELYEQKIIALGGEVPTLTIKGLGR